MVNVNNLIDVIKAAPKPVVVAIDGRAASGKTTLAKLIETEFNAQIIHMDYFFLPPDLRTKERFDEPGGNINYERFYAEVIPNLKKKCDFEYGVFDCSKMTISGYISVLKNDITVVEGSYSLHPRFGDYADIKIFVTVDETEQIERIKKRNGEKLLQRFLSEWIPMEEKYFEAFNIKQNCEYVLETGE